MGLGSEIDCCITSLHGFMHSSRLADIPFIKGYIPQTIFQALSSAAICQRIQDHDLAPRPGFKNMPDEVAADKAGAAGNKKPHPRPQPCFFPGSSSQS